MPRKSSVTKLPPALRDELDRAIREGRLSIDDLTAFVRDRGAEVSRSAVGRYVKNYEDQIADYRKTQELAKVLVGELQDNPQGDVGRLASEMIKLNILRGIESMREEGGELPPEQTMFLASALRSAGSFDKSNADLLLRLKKELATEAQAKLKALEGSAAKGAVKLDAETLKRIREEIYGIVG